MLLRVAQAAALGVKLPIAEPVAGMVIDIGAGATEVAVLSLGDVVAEKSVRTGGDQMDEAIVDWLRRNRGLRIGLSTAEQLRIALGSAWPDEANRSDEVRGLDVATGLPRRLAITSAEVREALAAPLECVLDAIRSVLDQCSPDLVADLIDRGLVLCGGGAQLRGLNRWITERTGIPAHLAADPQTAVVSGTLVCLEHLDQWRSLVESSDDAA
jgi:rod shape-determining protein MreB